jgi:large conductance mechanosensitive channel
LTDGHSTFKFAATQFGGGIGMLSGFKQFVLRGNVVDLAVGVVIGAAFGTVVTSFVKAFITPLVALIVGKRGDFSGISYTINGVVFPIGDFITALVSFALVAAVIYFFVVTPINALIARTRRATVPPDPTTKKCPECMSEIPIDARRCSQCTQPLMGKAA